jgi:protoheme ferro-lyase
MTPKLTPAGEAMEEVLNMDDPYFELSHETYDTIRQALEMLDRVQRDGPVAWQLRDVMRGWLRPTLTMKVPKTKNGIPYAEMRCLYALPPHPATENTPEEL